MMMLYFWIAAFVFLIIAEASTAQLVTIWFAIGAVGAIIANLLNAQGWLQWTIFVVVSVVALVATRPLVKKFTNKKIQPTNADRNIGELAIVLEDIDNTQGTGSVNVKGVTWTARSLNGQLIEKESMVVINKIEGVKLLVTKRDEQLK